VLGWFSAPFTSLLGDVGRRRAGVCRTGIARLDSSTRPMGPGMPCQLAFIAVFGGASSSISLPAAKRHVPSWGVLGRFLMTGKLGTFVLGVRLFWIGDFWSSRIEP
jgi:hypothetical protein